MIELIQPPINFMLAPKPQNIHYGYSFSLKEKVLRISERDILNQPVNKRVQYIKQCLLDAGMTCLTNDFTYDERNHCRVYTALG